MTPLTPHPGRTGLVVESSPEDTAGEPIGLEFADTDPAALRQRLRNVSEARYLIAERDYTAAQDALVVHDRETEQSLDELERHIQSLNSRIRHAENTRDRQLVALRSVLEPKAIVRGVKAHHVEGTAIFERCEVALDDLEYINRGAQGGLLERWQREMEPLKLERADAAAASERVRESKTSARAPLEERLADAESRLLESGTHILRLRAFEFAEPAQFISVHQSSHSFPPGNLEIAGARSVR